MKVALYIRVSTQEQANEGYSIGEQTERLTKYAQAHDWNIYKAYTDPGFTGSNMNRPALKNLINDVKNNKFDKVVVYKLDRLSRSQKDTLTLIEDIFLKNNVDFVSMSENFDTSTPFGKAMIGILAVFAQLEREQIKERMAMGKEARAKKGLWNGGSEAPYGYTYNNGLLIKDDFEAMIVNKIYDLAYQGISDRKIAEILNKEGYKTRRGKWARTSVRNILSRDIYSGIINYGSDKFEGIHEPIIESDTASEVSRIRKTRVNNLLTNNRPWKASSCISGLVYCAKCGGKYYIVTNRCKKDDRIYIYRRFSCENRENRGIKAQTFKCTNKKWRKEKLVDLVLGEIRKLATDPEYTQAPKEKTSSRNEISVIRSEIKKVDNQISKLVDLYSLESMPIDLIKQKIDDLNEKKNILKNKISAAQDDKKKNEQIKKVKGIIKQIPKILDNGTEEEIREVVVALIDRIEIDEDDVAIYWNI